MSQEEFFNERLVIFGPHDPRTLAWDSLESQKLRFDILFLIGNIEGSTVLDVGCGTGDFWGYLKNLNSNVSYTGIDTFGKFIEAAKNKFPDGRFELKNILDEDRRFDYVFASGIFGLKSETSQIYKDIIQKMFEVANQGVAFNMLSSYTEEGAKYGGLAYFNPEEVFSFCKSLTPLITLRHDYLKHDFTIYMYKIMV